MTNVEHYSSNGGDSNLFLPIWINASWTGGFTGPPNDRRDEDSNLPGNRCKPQFVNMTNHLNDPTLRLTSGCTGFAIEAHICTAKGGLPQPQGGISAECATNPFDTSILTQILITPGAGGASQAIASTQTLFINIFYCSTGTFLVGSPLRCERF